MKFDLFEEELYIHGLGAFRKIREMRPDDHFYCFAFFTSGEFAYMAATASSYEGLKEVAQQYKQMERYSHKELDTLRHELKWSPCDSPLHQECGGIIEPFQALMDQISRELLSIPVVNDDWSEFEQYVSQVDSAVEKALRRIDEEGVFGSGTERGGVVVNLLMGDQDDRTRIEFAKRVNPPESVQMLTDDLCRAESYFQSLSAKPDREQFEYLLTELVKVILDQEPNLSEQEISRLDIFARLTELSFFDSDAILDLIENEIHKPEFNTRGTPEFEKYGAFTTEAELTHTLLEILARKANPTERMETRLRRWLNDLYEESLGKKLIGLNLVIVARTLKSLWPAQYPTPILGEHDNKLVNAADFIDIIGRI